MLFSRQGKIARISVGTEKAYEDVDIHGKLFQDLRKRLARDMVRSGIQEEAAMKISGHKTRGLSYRHNKDSC